MANKIYNFLPAHLRNSELESIFDATLERAFSKGSMRKEKAFIGRREKGIYNEKDVYLSFPEHLFQRDNYGLEPVFSNTTIGDNIFYEDLLNAMFNKGMLTNDHRRLFKSDSTTVNLPIDADKFVNWSMYYWVSTGFFANGDNRQESDNKHYITVDKSSGNWWGENNAWYYYEDISDNITSDNKHLIEQAKRPIIEFDSRLSIANNVTEWELPLFTCSDGNAYNIFKYLTSNFSKKKILHIVITGLGNKSSDGDFFTGKIRKQFPLWLETDAFKKFVKSYSPCKIQHGGLGAFYVKLKSKE